MVRSLREGKEEGRKEAAYKCLSRLYEPERASKTRSGRDAILASSEHGLSNGRIESMNTKIRLITRIAFGFASPDALIALAMLSLGGHRPALPGRK